MESDSDNESGWEILTGLTDHAFSEFGDYEEEQVVAPSAGTVAVSKGKHAANQTIRGVGCRIRSAGHRKSNGRRAAPVRKKASVIAATDELVDADDMLAQAEEQAWKALEDQGFTKDQVVEMRLRKKNKEEVHLYSYLCENSTHPDQVDAYLRLALALDGLKRRGEAIERLQNALVTFSNDVRLRLALAKLLFRNDQKVEAQEQCKVIYNAEDIGATERQLGDAYYISGWTAIHMDDHTKAYEIWSQGHKRVPDDARLNRQFNKRKCWDVKVEEEHRKIASFIGRGAHGDGVFDVDNDVIVYKVPEHVNEPALALFDNSIQRNALVFKTKEPVLTKEECAAICRHVESHHKNCGGWSTVRQSSVLTTDVAVEDIGNFRYWLQQLMKRTLKPMLAACYPILADGTSLGEGGGRVRIHDAFIVRYDSTVDGSLSLPEHCDTSAFSFTVALNDSFEGGGTWFEALGPQGQVVTAEVGQAVAFAGPLRHAGYPIRSGTRLILVLFLYVENFHYGPFLEHTADDSRQSKTNCPCLEDETLSDRVDDVLPSGSKPGSYVVYRETVELMNALELSVEDP